MCGICCIFAWETPLNLNSNTFPKQTEYFLKNRGPNKTAKYISNDGLIFIGSVLWQQGSKLTEQPVVSDRWVLLLNGDIFNAEKEPDVSDTDWLIKELRKCNDLSQILALFLKIQGPFSIVLYDKILRTLYFFRDFLGRNSLLIEKEGDVFRILSSSCISNGKITMEVPPTGIFQIEMDNTRHLKIIPWRNPSEDTCQMLEDFKEKFNFRSIEILDTINPSWLLATKGLEESYDFFQLAHNISKSDLFQSFLTDENVQKSIQNLSVHLENSVRDRIVNTPAFCAYCVKNFESDSRPQCSHAKIGILFSGGIDCTILAALAHKFVPETEAIDLMNVAFQRVSSSDENLDWNVPDRLSAIESFNELVELYPSRTWNLVKINIKREELVNTLKEHICNLIYPLNTVLDESLGSAFWFAARGNGLLNEQSYQTNCRVILLGSGADELFGGYTRHSNAYKRCKGNHSDKLNALQNELDLDWERIPARNLSRDDRVISDHGRTPRAPFIEENLVKFVRSLRPEQKCCFNLDNILGDKLLLRLYGYQLGLRKACTFKKRAIQFGSRVANKNQNAKDISAVLMS